MEQEIEIKLICRDFPGLRFGSYSPVYVGMQCRKAVVDAVAGNTEQKEFKVQVRCNQDKQGRPNFLGPYVFGPTGDKFLYLVWFVPLGNEKLMFRRAKIKLNHLSWDQVVQAAESGRALVAHINMTDKKGEPVCASLKADQVRWEED